MRKGEQLITGGGFNTNSTLEGAKLPKRFDGMVIQRTKKNFVDINKDVRIIMNQKKIDRFKKQL